ncbi:MAG: hypothetical protein ACJAWW_000217 [Sulfurimonas sp.]|jgi:hypothetical protein
MRIILQVIVFLSISFTLVIGDEFREIKTISLKKDEQKKILVKYGDITKLFKFRWTLYKNEGLIIHRSYDKIVAQNILYLRHKNHSFRVELKPRGTDYYNVPYVLVKFKEFNYETKEAIFDLLLTDRSAKISLKYLKNS